MASILLLLCLCQADAPAADALIAKLEQSELVINGRPIPRVARHADGSVARVELRDLQLTHDEWKTLAALPRLEQLRANSSNIADEDVAAFSASKTLKSVNLSGTEVSDQVVNSLGQMPVLDYLCLGSVRITPPAVARLKSLHPKLKLGYYERGRSGFAGPEQNK